MDKAYEHVSWTYEPESNTANNPDEDVTTPQTTTVIHRHYHHHYHHHYTHTSPPPPTHSPPANPHSGHHRRPYHPNSSHSRVHPSPPRAQRQSSVDEQGQRYQSPPSPEHSSPVNTEQGSHSTRHRRQQRLPTPQRRASTRRYREASNDHSASPSPTPRRSDSPDQSRPNSRERYNCSHRERYARRREISREIDQTRRRSNERRPVDTGKRRTIIPRRHQLFGGTILQTNLVLTAENGTTGSDTQEDAKSVAKSAKRADARTSVALLRHQKICRRNDSPL